MEIKIRKADINDLEGLKELFLGIHKHHMLIDETYASEEDFAQKVEGKVLKALDKDEHMIFIAIDEENKNYVGFGFFQIVQKTTSNNKYGYINKAYLKSEYRGKGIFKQIYEKGMEWFKENGIEYIELTCNSRNVEGQRTWGGLGFEEVKKVMRKKI